MRCGSASGSAAASPRGWSTAGWSGQGRRCVSRWTRPRRPLIGEIVERRLKSLAVNLGLKAVVSAAGDPRDLFLRVEVDVQPVGTKFHRHHLTGPEKRTAPAPLSRCASRARPGRTLAPDQPLRRRGVAFAGGSRRRLRRRHASGQRQREQDDPHSSSSAVDARAQQLAVAHREGEPALDQVERVVAEFLVAPALEDREALAPAGGELLQLLGLGDQPRRDVAFLAP